MKEECIICGVKTEYDIQESIHNRYFYIEGAGQACENCYNKN